ncbi:MAG: Flp pilus assembly protein CpaB [Gammaproteobacteria bacterium]
MAINKKNKKAGMLPLLIGAIGFGIAAALLSVLYLKAKEAALIKQLAGEEQQMVSVVVAGRDLPRGSAIVDENFAVREVPANFVHGDVIYPGEYDRYRGRALTTDLSVGKPLLKSFLDEDFPTDFSDTIPVGRRALTVPVDEVNSVAGFIRPGNHIDLFVNIPYTESGFNPKFYTVGLFRELPPEMKLPGELQGGLGALLNQSPELADELLNYMSPGDVILPVLQDVRVLATGTDPYIESLDDMGRPQFRTDTNFTNVTLDVSPAQAALLTAAQDKGDLLAVLRNRKDESLADFTTISARDLFNNAAEMAAAERQRKSRAAVAGGVDTNGNLVDADGNRIMSRDQLAEAGLTVNENGQLVDKNGNIVDPKDVVVGPGGKVMTRQQLAEAGLSVNESGQIIDENGNVVSAEDLVTGADGKVMTRQQLAEAGLSVNENGEIVDNKGRVVDPDDVVVSKDGKVMTRQQLEAAGLKSAGGVDSSGNLVDSDGNVMASREQLEAAGYTVNENGEIVDKDGNVVDPGELVVDKNGKVMSRDNVAVAADGSIITDEQLSDAGLSRGGEVDDNGNLVDDDGNVIASREQLEAAGYSVNENGEIVDADGNVVDPNELMVDKNGNIVDSKDMVVASDGSIMTRQQLAEAGLSVNENGQIVDRNGNVVDPDDLITTKDGKVMSRKQLQSAGLKVNSKGEIVDADGRVLSSDEVEQVAKTVPIGGAGAAAFTYQMIIGGSSEDGVAKKTTVAVDQQE